MLKGIYLYVRSHGVKLTFDDFPFPSSPLPPPLSLEVPYIKSVAIVKDESNNFFCEVRQLCKEGNFIVFFSPDMDPSKNLGKQLKANTSDFLTLVSDQDTININTTSRYNLGTSSHTR